MDRQQRTGLDIGLIAHRWFPDVGGVQSHMRDLARELRSRGHRVHALCLDMGEGLEPFSHKTDAGGVRLVEEELAESLSFVGIDELGMRYFQRIRRIARRLRDDASGASRGRASVFGLAGEAKPTC